MSLDDASAGFRSAARDDRNDAARRAGVRIPLRAARLAAQNEREGLLRRLGEQGQPTAALLGAEIAVLDRLDAMLGGEALPTEPARGVRYLLAGAVSIGARLRSTGRDRSSREGRREAVVHALTDAAASARQEAHGLERRYNQELADSAALTDTEGGGEEDGGRLRALELSVTYLPTRLEALRAQAALFERMENMLAGDG